ncbi:VWA domain-containing protein [Dactylosporangium aurantiacum]|uniref:VWA domain-containing protein n=1 Tax=Dactylosporangium aurantiacum TaxID=35754 RepID=A0A9Q9MJ92_9ACTN|nr:Calx-beta domain-containing protein [Dactylosporangium aurantiacum]MDG6104312.1 Calx-beta domain-containing protein [Dactylosporangium aurantiacum]UWZ56695.1 VWA domain-containing protein [Dactylosporangium aurantiacum]
MKLAPLLSLVLTAGAVTVLSTATAAQAAPGVTPSSVSLTLGPGQSADIAKHVETAPVPPKPDIVFLADTTGSMFDPIADVRANAASVMGQIAAAQPAAQFGVAEYKDVEDSAPFTVRQDITADQAAVQAGIDQWNADGGGDLPEDNLNALFNLATGAVHFRDGGTRIIVIFGDAPSHDPSIGHGLADTVAALNAAHIRVVAVDVGGMNAGGQAEAITSGTGGVYLPDVPADEVSAAILAGIQAIQVKVTPVPFDCDANLAVSFAPPERTVDSGATADFTEHVTVAAGATAGTYTCKVDFKVDGVSQGAAFVQTLSVKVLTLSIDDVVVNENAGNATFTVSLSGTSTDPVSVNFATANGTATAGADYTGRTGTVTFTPGQTSRPVTVPIIDDAVDETDETFTVTLSGAAGAGIADGSGLGTIVDADRNGTFSCTAQVLRVGPLSSPAANPANVPCADDSRTLAQLGLSSGLITVESKTLDASTALTPDNLDTTPAAGDNGTATAKVEQVKITVGGIAPVTIELGVVQATAKATCATGPGGLAPVLTGASSISYLRINGIAVTVGSAPLTVPLVVGALKLNATTTTPTSVTQQAVVLDTLLTDVVISEAHADVHGSTANPTGNPCRV